jgi:hypothetical protein
MFYIFSEELSGQQIPQIPEQDVEKRNHIFQQVGVLLYLLY